VNRLGGGGEMVVVQCTVIRKWTEVLRRRTMWCGSSDKEMS
jgi:hypothetical protein